QLHALAGWDRLTEALSGEHLMALQQLFDELQPRLRLPLEATTSGWVLRGAAAELVESIERFNERWTQFLAKVDLGAVNRARDAYNRYFVLEKECAFGSASAARRDFQRLAPLT